MEDRNFKNVRLMIGEQRDDVRFGLKTALSGAGFQQVTDTSRIAKIRESVAHDRVDLLVCDLHMADGDFDGLIHQIRHQEVGRNPFVTIITLLPDADETLIRKAMGSGTDDILVMPVSPENLTKRVLQLTRERKPFVVTTDYIGPDRRNGHRPGTMRIPLIPVPNPLRVMIDNEPDRGQLKMEIEEAARVLNEQKVERHAFQIVYLVDKIVEVYPDKPRDEVVRAHLDRLAAVSDDIAVRLDGTPFAHWQDRCQSLAGIMDRVRGARMAANDTDVFELRTLADGFKSEIAGGGLAARTA